MAGIWTTKATMTGPVTTTRPIMDPTRGWTESLVLPPSEANEQSPKATIAGHVTPNVKHLLAEGHLRLGLPPRRSGDRRASLPRHSLIKS